MSLGFQAFVEIFKKETLDVRRHVSCHGMSSLFKNCLKKMLNLNKTINCIQMSCNDHFSKST